MDTVEAQRRMESRFPALLKVGYCVASDEDSGYNCIAWAAGRSDQWWEPSPGYYWPDGSPAIDTVEALMQVFRDLGYEVCANGHAESGFQKIAIFAEDEIYTHAARQLDDGKWTSKIGAWEDIEHSSCEGLEGNEYGKVRHFMKRPKT